MPQQPKQPSPITIEGVRLIFRNFSGRISPYNREGVPEFSVVIDDETAAVLAADTWNVKQLQPRNEEDVDPQPFFLPVAVKWDGYPPPKVVMVTSRNRTYLDAQTISQLDYAEIINVDIIIRGYRWENPDGKTGIKAYVKSLFVTIQEDFLDVKYSMNPDEQPLEIPAG